MKAIIFGAGKIARGFVAHLLRLADIPFVFVESNRDLVRLLNERGSYHVNIMGNPARSLVIDNVRAIELSDRKAIAREWAESPLAFTSVGGKNLEPLAGVFVDALAIWGALKPGTIRGNVITCENWKEPAALLRSRVLEKSSSAVVRQVEKSLGFSEAVVMRSGIEPSEEQRAQDPLWVNAQDFWQLPVDAERIIGEPVPVGGIDYIHGFSGYLERKFYTYNAANGTASYLGHLRGHRLLADAAHDPWIVQMLQGVYDETGRAVVAKHGTPPERQREFAASSLKKLQDRNIIDFVERNARDPLRKLGPEDRLVGSARLVESQHIEPCHLANSIAAALHYFEPADPSAVELRRRLEAGGIDALLREVCSISPDEPLGQLVKQAEANLWQMGILR